MSALLRALLVPLACLVIAREARADEIVWHETLTAAFEQAKESRRIIMVCVNAKFVRGRQTEEPAAKGLREVVYKDERVVEKSRAFECALLPRSSNSAEFGELRLLEQCLQRFEKTGIDIGKIIAEEKANSNNKNPAALFNLAMAEEKRDLYSLNQVIQLIKDAGRKGLSIQRYKGLGEMNPEQLWSTTMDPDHRRILQVKIEDAAKADEIFTVLMGDQVDPRRHFIQTHAPEVRNLDV